jgi:hypothetical protein
MAIIKILKFYSGIPREMDTTNDDIAAKTFVVGGPSGTALTKANLDTLIGGNTDASSLHNHDTRYYTKAQTDAQITAAAPTATQVSYNNTTSGLTGTNVQTAIDQLDSRLDATEIVANGAIPLTQKGAINGVASLDSGGKVPIAQLPNSILEYVGTYNASTNTPSLSDYADATAAATHVGDVYKVSVAGTRNFGSGAITFVAGDYAIVNSLGKFELAHAGSDAVNSVNGFAGVVVLTTDNVNEGTVNLYYTDARAQAATITQSITSGLTTKAPSSDAVFTALAGKANTALSNLATTAINVDLKPGSTGINVGAPSGTTFQYFYADRGFTVSAGGSLLGPNQGITAPDGTTPSINVRGNGSAPSAITSQDTFGASNSQNVLVQSGNPVNGNSGDIKIRSGIPTGTGTRGKVTLDGASIDVSSKQIINVATPSLSTDAANKGYVDSNAANKTLSNLSAPTAVNQDLLPATSNTYNLGNGTKYWYAVTTGITATNSITTPAGNGSINIDNDLNVRFGAVINMNSANINNLADPTTAQQAATKAYTDAAVAPVIAAAYLETFTSGEVFALHDLLVVRRDGSNNPRVYKASSAAADNADFNDNGRWEVIGYALAASTASGQSISVQKAGKLTLTFETTPVAADIGKTVFLSTTQGQAVVGIAPTASGSGIVALGRLVSATQIEFHFCQLRGVNG